MHTLPNISLSGINFEPIIVMLSLSFLSRAAMGAALGVAAVSADASITAYTTQSSFEAALLSWGTDTFDALPTGIVPSPITRAIGNTNYTASADGDFYVIGNGTGAWLSTNNMVPITFDTFGGGVDAVGGLFFATAIDGSYLTGESITLTATDAGGNTALTFISPATRGSDFVGFVSTTGIGSLQVSVVDTGTNNAWVTGSDLTVGLAAAPIAAVPEPQSYLLMLSGLASVAAIRRLRAKNQRRLG